MEKQTEQNDPRRKEEVGKIADIYPCGYAMELGLIASSSVLKHADNSENLMKAVEVVEKRIRVIRERIQDLE